jgi:hypothetical protein
VAWLVAGGYDAGKPAAAEVVHGARCAGCLGQAVAMGPVPQYYVALELTGSGECCRPGLWYAPRTQAAVRVTATGAALATISPPRPYGTFTGVSAAADNRTFVLAAQLLARLPL